MTLNNLVTTTLNRLRNGRRGQTIVCTMIRKQPSRKKTSHVTQVQKRGFQTYVASIGGNHKCAFEPCGPEHFTFDMT